MTRVNAVGWDELYKTVRQAATKTPQVMEQMIEKGAEVYVKVTQGQVEAFGLVDTGITKESVKAGPIARVGDGLTIEVWPQGRRKDKKHPKGERNETIAFVNEYGLGGNGGRPFMSAAAEIAEDEAPDQMLTVLEKEQGL